MHTHSRLVAFVALSSLAALGASSASAQVPYPPGMPAYQATPIYQSLIAISPLSIAVDIGSIEGETSISGGATIGASASYADLQSDGRFSTIEGKFRYYTGDIPYRGFAVGAGLGLTRFSKQVESNFDDTESWQSLDAPTIGMLLDYDWSNSSTHRFVVGAGVEAKRIIATDEDRNRVDLPPAYLSFRFVVGLAF